MYQKRKQIDVASRTSLYTTSRKGQATIFIIVGILLALALVLVVTLRKEVLTTFKPEELIPTQRGKIENFIIKCIEDKGEEALFQLGQQSGYVEVPVLMQQDGSRHLRLGPGFVVPYWAYGPVTEIPSLQRVKEEIDIYIEENVPGCLLETTAFQETYIITEKSPIEADTEIGNNKILFKVHWNLEIRDKDGKVVSELIEHQGESQIKLKRVYETAKKIIEEEMRTLKLEDITQDLIALEHPKLPVVGMELSCSRKLWKVDEAKRTLQDLLRVNVRKLQITGTEVIEYPDEFPYYQNHYVWDFGENFQQEDVSVVFQYDNNFPFTFQVTPTEGKVMSSSSFAGRGSVSLLCIQNWKFTYDVSYPVLLRVNDETTGYAFTTAFTVHLIHNFPNRQDLITARPSAGSNLASDERFCQDARIPMTVLSWELVENEAQGIYQAEPLDTVNISFTCIKYRCELGETAFNFANRGYQAGLSRNFPYCPGGIMRAEKGNYKQDWMQITTEPGLEVELYLQPLFQLPAAKMSLLLHKVEDTTVKQAKELPDDYSVFIQLTLRKGNDTAAEPFHQSNVVYSPILEQPIIQQSALEFLAKVDFTYDLQIDVFDENAFVGGYRGNWTVPWEQLQQANTVIFHAVDAAGLSEEESFELLLSLPEKSKLLPAVELQR